MNIHLKEKVNPAKVSFLLEQDELYDDPLKNTSAFDSLKKYYNGYRKTKEFAFEYRPAKHMGTYGRIYPFNTFGQCGQCTGLATFPKAIRAYFAHKDYVDIDMKKAHWYILRYLFKKNGLDASLIDTILKGYAQIVDFFVDELKVEEDQAKGKIFSALYSSPTYMSHHTSILLETYEEFALLHKLLYGPFLDMMRTQYADLFALVQKSDKKSKNLNGSFISHILQHNERLLMQEVLLLLGTEGIQVGSLIHDGFLVLKKSLKCGAEDSLFEKVYNVMAERHPGLQLYLCVKPWPEWPDHWIEDIAASKANSKYAKLATKLVSHMTENSIIIDEIRVYQKSQDHPMVFKKLYDSYHDYIVEVFEGNYAYEDAQGNFEAMISLLEKRKVKEIKNLVPNMEWMAFKNGALNLETREFVPLAQISIDTEIIARHYLEIDFDIANFETPLFDNLVNYQLQDAEALKWFYVLCVARLLFVPSNDPLHVIPFIHGLRSTGKSTLINIISAFFPEGTIGSINSSQEQTFGMDNLADKQVILASDLPEDLAKVLGVDLFKSMVSGEAINVAVKNKKSFTRKWQVPVALVSNYLPNWNNSGGALSKRLAIFKFTREVASRDSNLEFQIKSQELPAILNKALLYYGEIKKGTKTFEDIAPSYFQGTVNEYCESVDTLFQFLNQLDNEDKNGTTHRIVFDAKDDECYELLSYFELRYDSYLKFRRQRSTYVKGDYSTLLKFGCTVVAINICKSCKHRGRKGCCLAYAPDNRKKLQVVQGIKFVSEEIGNAVSSILLSGRVAL